MWLLVMFDLPTLDKEDIKAYSKFRTSLLREGFNMVQYSVYSRNTSDASSQSLFKRVRNKIPNKGHVRLMSLTDQQYAGMRVVIDREEFVPEKAQNVFTF